MTPSLVAKDLRPVSEFGVVPGAKVSVSVALGPYVNAGDKAPRYLVVPLSKA